jgi:Uma2 family endonuclease
MTAVSDVTPIVPKTHINGSNRRLISVAEYDRMTELGFFDDGEKVELLNGEIIEIMAKVTKHTSATSRINRFLIKIFDEKAIVRVQDPIVLDNFSEPEPDVVLAKWNENEYLDRHPKPEDVYLVMEISDTTLYQDRETKSLAYARAGIAQYLLLNVNDQTIEDYREPNFDGYEFKKTHRIGGKFNLVAFPEIEIKVDEILVANAEN